MTIYWAAIYAKAQNIYAVYIKTAENFMGFGCFFHLYLIITLIITTH